MRKPSAHVELMLPTQDDDHIAGPGRGELGAVAACT